MIGLRVSANGAEAASVQPAVIALPATSTSAATPTSAPTSAAMPAVQEVKDTPVTVQAGDLSFTVQPGGDLKDIQYRGVLVLREALLDIRTSEWHRVRLTAANSHVTVTGGKTPTVSVAYHIAQPELGINLSGRESIRVLQEGGIRLEASVDPTAASKSNRLSINLVFPADTYTGKSIRLAANGGSHEVAVPAEPLFPIQFATDIRRLVLAPTGIVVRPISGKGALEDLRHYGLGELWYEQAADYHYPSVPQADAQHMAMDILFPNPNRVAERLSDNPRG